jgi:hypothetical protein
VIRLSNNVHFDTFTTSAIPVLQCHFQTTACCRSFCYPQILLLASTRFHICVPNNVLIRHRYLTGSSTLVVVLHKKNNGNTRLTAQGHKVSRRNGAHQKSYNQRAITSPIGIFHSNFVMMRLITYITCSNFRHQRPDGAWVIWLLPFFGRWYHCCSF